MQRLGLFVALGVMAGCGPTISEARLAAYPPRSDNCELDFVEATGAEMSAGGKWRVIGYVSLDGVDKGDPFAPRKRDLVRPRICQMGGVAVAVAVAGVAQAPADSGSGVTYAALRLADEPAQETASTF